MPGLPHRFQAEDKGQPGAGSLLAELSRDQLTSVDL